MLCGSMSTERIMDWFLVAFLLYVVLSIVSLFHVSSAEKAVFRIEEQVERLVEIVETTTPEYGVIEGAWHYGRNV